MLIPPRKPGQKKYFILYTKPGKVASVNVFAKDENEAKKTFKKHVGDHEILNIREA